MSKATALAPLPPPWIVPGPTSAGGPKPPVPKRAPAPLPPARIVARPAPAGAKPAAAARLDRQPTREDVRAAYRLFLGREPENEAQLDNHLAQSPSFHALTEVFTSSAEFRRRLASAPAVGAHMPLTPPRLEIEVEADGPTLAAMLERTGRYWAHVGAEAPHWSVLTSDRFRPDSIAETRREFYATGAYDSTLVLGMLARQGIDPASLARVVEFGCGVGRATVALAPHFRSITGCDISQPHLDLARQEAEARHIGNLRWHHSTMALPLPPGGYDLWYSRIVLQHNPPPVIAHLLRQAFQGLAPGGIAIFQVPVHNVGYDFSIARYLARTGHPGMEMHVLPQRHVFALAAEAGLQVMEVREDSHSVSSNPSIWLSNTFVLRRPA